MIQFLQPTPDFVLDFIVNYLQKLNSEILVIWEDWGLITRLGANGSKMIYQPYIRFSQSLILFEELRGLYLNKIIWKI